MAMRSVAKKVAYTGMLFALAAALSYAESLVPALLGLLPGIKLGLSNIVTMFCLFFMGTPSAAAVLLLKSGFVLLTRGVTAALLSLVGGFFSLLVMSLLYRLGRGKRSVGFLSAAGGVCHNVGQLAASWLILGTGAVFYYVPVLVISGIAMGLLTGLVFRAAAPYLRRIIKPGDD